jgi:hypothetical protein
LDIRIVRQHVRDMIRRMCVDEHLRNLLANMVEPVPGHGDLYRETGDILVDSDDQHLGLDKIESWGWLLTNTDNIGAKFVAEIAYEFNNRIPTKFKYSGWDTGRISEYVTRKIIRQMMATIGKKNINEDPWWKHEFLRHILLGLGPWAVGDDVDDASTAEMSIATSQDAGRSFGTGPWPKNDGTG